MSEEEKRKRGREEERKRGKEYKCRDLRVRGWEKNSDV